MEKKNRNTWIATLIAAIGSTVVLILGPFRSTSQEQVFKTREFDFSLQDAPEIYNSANFLAAYNTYSSKEPWMLVHWSCLKNDIHKNPRFFGVGNTLSVGTIWQKDYASTRTTIDSLHISNEEMRRFIKRGEPSTCNVWREVNVSPSVFLNVSPTYFTGIDTELGFMLKNFKTTRVSVESFVPIDLLTGELIYMLDSCNDSRCRKYLRWFNEEGNLISTWTYEVNGVSMLVETYDTISVGLKAKLTSDTLHSLPIQGTLKTNFSYVNARTIQITTHNPFYVIGGVKKIFNIQEKKKK
jgi:hypothetical protein